MVYDNEKWKKKYNGLKNAVESKGFKFITYELDDTYKNTSESEQGFTSRRIIGCVLTNKTAKVFNRGIAIVNDTEDYFCRLVGKYYALKRAFQAALRKKDDEKINDMNRDIVLEKVEKILSSNQFTPVKHFYNKKFYIFKSAHNVTLTKPELKFITKKLAAKPKSKLLTDMKAAEAAFGIK